MKKLLLKNARIVSSHGIDEKDVVVSGGEILKVCEIGEGEDLLAGIVDEEGEKTFASGEQSMEGASSEESEIIDCGREGLYLLPGLIDAHVHFREPGLTQKADFESESCAALSGGVTTIFDMPNTVPPVLTYDLFGEKLAIAKEKCKCHFKLFFGVGMVEGESNLSELIRVYEDDGLRGFLAGAKVYMGHSTGGLGVDASLLEEILGSKELGDLPVVVHAEDQNCLLENSSKFDLGDPASHGEARPIKCCVEAVKEACHLAKKHNRPVHIAHVSSREELDVIAKFNDGARSAGDGSADGKLVTCEVSTHHLFLSEDDYEKYGHFLKVNPPVRSVGEVAELWKAVYSGEIDIIATDHSPHTRDEKECETGVGQVPPSGMPEVQTLLPLLLNEVSGEKLGLKDVVRLCCERPAEIFGLSDVGVIADGARADLVLVDMEKSSEVCAENLLYKCGWSNYEGRTLYGVVEEVILAGEVV